MDSPKVIVVLGSVREGRMADRVGDLVVKELKNLDFNVRLFDPKELGIPLLRQPLHFMKDQSAAPAPLVELDEMIKGTDCFVIVSSEYNCTIPAALTNMLDHFPPDSYRHKPAAIVTYSVGSFGGARAGCILRPYLSELGMFSIPSYLVIPAVSENVTPEGGPGNERIANNCTKLMKELLWYANAMKKQIEAEGTPN